MAAFILFICWFWAVVFGFFAQDYALPLMGLQALGFGSYVWVSVITSIAWLPLSAFNMVTKS